MSNFKRKRKIGEVTESTTRSGENYNGYPLRRVKEILGYSHDGKRAKVKLLTCGHDMTVSVDELEQQIGCWKCHLNALHPTDQV